MALIIMSDFFFETILKLTLSVTLNRIQNTNDISEACLPRVAE